MPHLSKTRVISRACEAELICYLEDLEAEARRLYLAYDEILRTSPHPYVRSVREVWLHYAAALRWAKASIVSRRRMRGKAHSRPAREP